MTNAQLETAENEVQLENILLVKAISEGRNNYISLVSSTKTSVFLPVSKNLFFLSHSLGTSKSSGMKTVVFKLIGSF